MVDFMRNIPLLVTTLFLCGCSNPPAPKASVPWQIPTHYYIYDCPQSAEAEIPALLKSYGYMPKDKKENGVFAFSLTGISSLESLRDVQEKIITWSKQKRVPLALNNASLVFSSVQGKPTSKITINLTFTPKSHVEIDVGGKIYTADAKEETGEVTLEVPDAYRSAIAQRGGWIYFKFEKNGAVQYSRVNVLTNVTENIGKETVPTNSLLLPQPQTPDSPSAP